MDLSSPDVERALEIVGDAMELHGAELEEYLDRVCGESSLLRTEVLNFLRYDSPHSILRDQGDGSLPEPSIDQASGSRYELHGEIARGGMGVIHHARDTALGRDVAVKLLHESRQDDANYIRRFVREAQISAQLQHPGIPPIHEIGRLPDGRVFISMKLINGHTLESILSARQRPEDDLSRMIGIFEQVCQTIAFAHSRGVIHRDLKPSNIMVGEFGEVQVMDWGLAKTLDDASEKDESPEHIDESPSDSSGFETRLGSMMGTPGYMSLEQAMGRARKATDVFALGAILSDVLTGRLRKNAKSPVEHTMDVVKAELEEVWHRLDAVNGQTELVELSKQCLQLYPDDRPRDAGDVARRVSLYSEALRTQLHAAELAAVEARAVAHEERKRRRILVVATTCVVIAFCIGGWLLWRHAKQLEENAALQRQVAEVEASESYRTRTVAAYHEFDSGRFFQARELLDESPERYRNWEWYYLSDQADQSVLTIETEADGIPLTGFVAGADLIVSVFSDNAAHHWNRLSGVHVSTASPGAGRPLALDPTGKLVLSQLTDSNKLLLWNAASGEVLREFAGSADPRLTTISYDGSYVAIDYKRSAVELFEVKSGKLARTFDDLHHPMFVKDKNWLVGIKENAVQFWDLTNGQAARPPLHLDGINSVAESSVTRDGSLLAARIIGHRIRVWDLNTGESRDLNLSRTYSAAFAFDTTGTRLISTTQEGPIQVWNPKTAELLQTITFVNGHTETLHEASLDDPALLTSVIRDGHAEIRVWDLRANDVRVLQGHESYVYPVAMSPNGDVIASGSWDHTVRIWDVRSGAEIVVLREHSSTVYGLAFDSTGSRLVSASGDGKVIVWDTTTYTVSNQLDLSPATAYTAAFSPDDSLLVVACGGLNVFDGTTFELKRELRSATLDHLDPAYVTSVVFSPRGDEFISYWGKHWEANRDLTVWDASTLEPKKRLRPPYERVFAVTYSPDGSQIAMTHQWGEISLWRTDELDQPFAEIHGHSEEAFDIAYLPDGSRLMTAGRDNTIRMWDAENHRQLAVLRGHDDYVFSLAISQDGQRIVSSSGDGTVRIWETTPLTDRLESMRIADTLRPRAESLVGALFNEFGESDTVVEHLQTNTELSPAMRREAMFAVARRTHD